MSTIIRSAATLIASSLLSVTFAADPPPIIYPSKGQTAEQQQKDLGECESWSKQSTGIDPVALAAAPATPTATSAPQQSSGPKGERLRGAARGAAAGALIGEVANNDASEGAAVGAAAGVIAGGRQARHNQAQTQQQAAAAEEKATVDAEAAKQEKVATYNRARNACMEGRGYIVK
jgi:hypothetical protein